MKLSGWLIQITPVVIEHIVIPLNRESISLKSLINGTWEIAFNDKKAAASKPTPDPSSP